MAEHVYVEFVHSGREKPNKALSSDLKSHTSIYYWIII